MSSHLTPQEIAELVREGMYAQDDAVRALGIAITVIGPGSATATMTVRPDMLQGHATCHGGMLATLADTAFAYACNACNEVTVASGFSIDIMSAAREGDLLTAVAHEVQQGGRLGVYDVAVHNQRGEAVAAFRGRSYRKRGQAVVTLPLSA